MKQSCGNLWSEIVEMAHGAPKPEAAAHLEGCPSCKALYTDIREVVGGLQAGVHEAPAALIASAKALMPAKQHSLVARLLRTNLGIAGVRATAPDSIQALFEANSHQIRVQYRALPKGWEVLGNAPGGIEGDCQGKTFEIDDQGRFELKVKSLRHSGFNLRLDDALVIVPPIEEIFQDER